MVTTPKKTWSATTNPIVWAIALVLVMVAAGYTYTIVFRCQTSTFEAIKLISISMGQCDAPSPPAKDKLPEPQPAIPPQPTKISRGDLPCRWVWVYMGKYSHAKGEYLLPPAFRFADSRGPSSPFPKAGDRVVLTADRTIIVTGFGDAPETSKCERILHAPWGYNPKTTKIYEAGTLKKDSQVAVNNVVLMPSQTAEPTYVWALVGPEQ